MKSEKRDFERLRSGIPGIFLTDPADVPFEYKIGSRRYKGIPESFSPVIKVKRIDSNVSVITVTGRTPKGLELKAKCTQYADYPVTEWVMYIKNKGRKNSPQISEWNFTGNLYGKNPVLVHGNGDTCGADGYEWFETPVTGQTFTVAPYDTGVSCQGAFPYMRLRFKDWGANIAIGWTGSWKTEAKKIRGGVSFSASQKYFDAYLKPGETVRTPSVITQYYDGNDDRGRNLWRSWYIEHILPKENGQPLPPKLVVHTWMIDNLPEFCGVTEKNQLEAIETYIKKGIKPDIWWIDAGWYECDNYWPHTGTWEPHPEHFPNGFGKMGDFIESKGIDLLVWFEPERVMENTELWNEHPDFLLKLKRECDEWSSKNALLNLGNPEALSWITDKVDSIIKEAKIKIYRQDFNYAPGPIWEDNEEEGRKGMLENLHIQGYYKFWDTLIERNPGLIMDSCSSGGRRNDIETMKRAVPLHYTDVGYGNHPIKQKQHREMFEWIPYFRAHTYNWDNPDGTYTEWNHIPTDDFAYQNAFTPAITSMIEYYDSEELFKAGIRNHPVWRKCAEIELSADYYPLTECRKDAGDWYAMQFDGKTEGFIQIIRNILVKEDTVTVKPYAEKGVIYEFTDVLSGRSFRMTGEDIRKKGFTDTLPERSGVVWFYKKYNA